MKTYNNLPKEYIVECTTAEETTEVANFIKDYKNKWDHYKYVYNCKQYSPGAILWDTIFKDVEHLPIISFKEWKEVFLNKEEEFILPEEWYCPYSNKKEFDIMNEFFGNKWEFIYPEGYRGCNNDSDKNNWNCSWESYGERITFEQFKKYVMKEKEFVLPEKYCVKHYQSVAEYIIKLEGSNWGNFFENLTLYSHFPQVKGLYCYSTPQPGYTEITIEEFNKYVLNKEHVPERLSFYVRYCKEFTEDIYNALNEWCKNNTKGIIRGYEDNFNGLKDSEYYLFDNWGLHNNDYNKIKDCYSYGVDNNRQGCKEEYSIEQVKRLIKYKEKEMKKKTQVFKVGDIVEITEVSKGSINTLRKGIIVAQNLKDKGWYYVGYGSKNEATNEKRWEYADNLKESSFEVNDVVVVIDNHTSSSNNIGDTGIITSSTGSTWVEDCKKITTGKFTSLKDIRFATEEEITAFSPIYENFLKDKSKTFAFDDTTITVSKGKISLGEHGNITIKELENVINWVTNRPKISGYTVNLLDTDNDYIVFDDDKLCTEYVVNFGCQQDSFNILLEVRDAYYELNK